MKMREMSSIRRDACYHWLWIWNAILFISALVTLKFHDFNEMVFLDMIHSSILIIKSSIVTLLINFNLKIALLCSNISESRKVERWEKLFITHLKAIFKFHYNGWASHQFLIFFSYRSFNVFRTEWIHLVN